MNDFSGPMTGTPIEGVEALESPLTIGAEAYVSREYARAEQDKLWRKTWLQAGRLADIPEVGNYLTFNVLDDNILLVRTAADSIKAYYNVCPHRGRQLVDVPEGARNARGKRMRFVCGFHGWTFDLQGKCVHISDAEHWQGRLDDDNTRLGEVKCETWGGWIWINMDPAAIPLGEYLEPAATLLAPFELDKMQCRWRKWIVFDCNWKVALEAFNETYHVAGTHPEFLAFGDFPGWARNHGLHSNIGYDAPKGMDENQQAKLRIGTGDARISTAKMQAYTWDAANTNTTQTLVDAAQRLEAELPAGTPAGEVLQHWLKSARADDAARGVIWPDVDAAHNAKAGTSWQIFPNSQIGHAVNNMLCYSARPFSDDPGKCIFEASVFQLYPEGTAPDTEWEYTEIEDWPYVLQQDFVNMAAVQKGLRNAGFRGTKPNPYRERAITSLHYNLSTYMGTGAPRKIV